MRSSASAARSLAASSTSTREPPVAARPGLRARESAASRINGGDAEQKGCEVEFLARPIEGFSIDGSLSYLDFQYTELAPGTTISLDEPFAGVPKWKWNLGAQYEIPLGGSFGSLGVTVFAGQLGS